MTSLRDKRVLVAGLGKSGVAAAQLLCRNGAIVTVVDRANHESLRTTADQLKSSGISVCLGIKGPVEGVFDLLVISPGIAVSDTMVRGVIESGAPVIGELELGYEYSRCPCVGITGTNGKTTTTELIERVGLNVGRKTIAAGNIGNPVCAVAEQSETLDYLTLEVSSFQLETIRHFHPHVAVLTNITPDHLDRYADMADYTRAKARIFENQTSSDWAIIECEALRQLKALNISVAPRVVTYSATDPSADLYVKDQAICARVTGWKERILDLQQARLTGPHNIENMMAALAVGCALELPLEGVVEAICSYTPAPHRCEFVAEIDGVRFVNDSKATNVDAVAKAILTMPTLNSGEPNIWLIAGGKDKGFDYSEVGPLLSQRVKGVFLIGETAPKILNSWKPFAHCELAVTLETAVELAGRSAVGGDVVLLSPACSSFDQFHNYQHRGEVFRAAVRRLTKAPVSDCICAEASHNEKRNLILEGAKPGANPPTSA